MEDQANFKKTQCIFKEARGGNWDGVKLLLDQKSNVDEPNCYGTQLYQLLHFMVIWKLYSFYYILKRMFIIRVMRV